MKTTQKLGFVATTFSLLVISAFLGLSSANASDGIQTISGHGTQQTANFCRIYPWMCR